DAETPQPQTLFQAALAFRRAGSLDRAEQTWKRLAATSPEGVVAGGQTIPLAELEKELSRAAGDATDVADSAFLPEARSPRDTGSDGPARAWVQDAVRRLEAASQPILPAFTPLTVGGKVVYR